ncbi:MAG TPA: hypothetical protein VNR87_06675 [Flavisolibacter sp.]|nr:hypothetical protein [Flavisolibacter sp.]
MANTFTEYEIVPIDNWTEYSQGDRRVDLKKCCMHENPDDQKCCDCCYDEWSNQLNEKQKEYGTLVENAAQAQASLIFYKGRRDGLKKWLDDLTQLEDYTADICDQFDLIISQVDKICYSAGNTVKAVEILFCMVRDFYSQIDEVKKYYEAVMSCIKKLNSSVLGSGGVIKCLEMYYEKLDAVIKTREDLVKQVMEAIRLANMLRQDVCSPFGLSYIFQEWQYILKCNVSDSSYVDDKSQGSCSDIDDKCIIYPQLTFPIGKSKYKSWVQTRFTDDDKAAKDAAALYLSESKKKEAISASINSLKEAVSAVDPKERCK